MGTFYDSGLHKSSECMTSIKNNMIIAYRLKPLDMPINPYKVWHGKVIWCNEDFIQVEMLEPGYNGLTETISYSQVIGVA